MQHFSEEELQELELLFGLKRNKEVLVVRDGVITKENTVWFRAVTGPELVDSKAHWENISRYPNVYQVYKPDVLVTYKD